MSSLLGWISWREIQKSKKHLDSIPVEAPEKEMGWHFVTCPRNNSEEQHQAEILSSDHKLLLFLMRVGITKSSYLLHQKGAEDLAWEIVRVLLVAETNELDSKDSGSALRAEAVEVVPRIRATVSARKAAGDRGQRRGMFCLWDRVHHRPQRTSQGNRIYSWQHTEEIKINRISFSTEIILSIWWGDRDYDDGTGEYVLTNKKTVTRCNS